MATDRVIAVTGATGRQGGAVARHLLADGWRVRALTRDPNSAKARALVEAGADVVKADMDDPDTLSPAIEGAYGVYSVQNFMISGLEAEVRQGKNVADAAKAAGVGHLVHGSAGTGYETGVGSWDSKLAVRAYMRELGLPVTELRPMAFMELMTDKGYFPPVSAWHLMPKLMGADRPVVWISVDDLGAIAARVFADPDRFLGADIPLAADVRSMTECREIWREVMGKPPKWFPMPVWLFERFVGPDLTRMWRWLRTADIALETASTLEILPSAATVREWLVRQRPARR
ncbi:NmrA/HSCARG family protein [Actinokineospora xionganensis]|uniref:NmrA/HSCARG family protein n=1 Tax=Actinokineospora xionganensis TaxID=2684470 RepID=A0ABR7KZC8_9PSEU|nr:NmrA/HSCARG family protein [Actinokineospora xionganensis]MBC6445707.1 NmrA/HSCARG family protein [Actinokineospora xionganensis]